MFISKQILSTPENIWMVKKILQGIVTVEVYIGKDLEHNYFSM